MAKEVIPQEEQVVIPTEQEVAEATQTVAQQEQQEVIDYDKVVRNLIANGWKRQSALKVKNVNVTEKDEYIMVSFTIVPHIAGYVYDADTDSYVLGKTNTVFSSNYAIAGVIKNFEDLAFIANGLQQSPTMVNSIFNGGAIDIISKTVKAGEEYVNPFSQSVEPTVFDHDTIINLIVKLVPSKVGLDILNEGKKAMAAKLFGL